MAKQASPIAEIVGIDFSFNIRYTNAEDPNSPEKYFQENANVNFRDEQALNKIVSEKPYLSEVIPILAAKFKKDQETISTVGTELKSKVKQIFGA